MSDRVDHFLSSDAGSTAAEYAVVASLIALAIVSAVAALGTSVAGLYDSVAAGL